MNMKKFLRSLLVLTLIFTMLSGCKDDTSESETVTTGSDGKFESTSINVFIAASLSNAMEEVKELYNEKQPNVNVVLNSDSSGTLMVQIQEGATCDIFFSASTSKMKTLESDALVVKGTRVDLLNNQVVLIAGKDNGTKVTGFEDMDKASNIAIADGSVPVGKYTRQILMSLGIIDTNDNPASITTSQISQALGDMEINECSNVSKVAEAVKEGSNEIGTVYYSDAYSVKDYVDIIEYADSSLSGDIVYPVAQIINDEADSLEKAVTSDFIAFLQTDEAKAVFEKYMFTIN